MNRAGGPNSRADWAGLFKTMLTMDGVLLVVAWVVGCVLHLGHTP